MGRYYNFVGEGLAGAREVGALAVLEVHAPSIDYPGSPKARLVTACCSSNRCADGATASAAWRT